MSKKRRNAKPKSSILNTSNMVIGGGLIAILIVGILIATRQDDNADNGSSQAQNQSTVQMPHLHGLSFSADGQQLIAPAHIGLVIFEDNQWSIPDIPSHDYMGYSGVDDGFFSSGHPSVDSGLINPLGLVKSTDGGHSISTIDFDGETDFHLMAVGYQNHAIYVLNPQPNSTLPAGLNYSLDEGQSWQPSVLEGLEGSMSQIAVHPTDAASVAIATQTGLFLSDDFGATFNQIGDIRGVSAVSFHPNGNQLLFGNTALYTYDLASEQIATVSIPPLRTNDFVGFIAASPANDGLAFATFAKNIHLSHDNGQSWIQIARDGVGINP